MKQFIQQGLNFYIMKNLFLFLTTVLIYINGQAQLHDKYWAFGIGCLLEFSDSTLKCLEPTNLKAKVNGYAYSDAYGELWFYTNGYILLYPNGDTVPNGYLTVDAVGVYGSSIWQSSIALPHPSDSNKVYIIYKWPDIYFDGQDFGTGLAYSLFDKSLAEGNGDIDSTFKDIEFYEDWVVYNIAATKHANGRDWWIVSHESVTWDFTTNTFITFLVQPDGITGPYYQDVGMEQDPGSTHGQFIFNQQGNMFVYEIQQGTVKNIGIFSFNRCDGTIEQIFLIDSVFSSGRAFSPDGKYLYMTEWFSTNVYLVQYKLEGASNSEDVINSREVIMHMNLITDEHSIGQFQMGLNNKLYFTTLSSFEESGYDPEPTPLNTYLNVINEPNQAGMACDIQISAIDLCGGIQSTGLPNMPNYRLGALQGSECDTLNTAIIEEPKPEIEYSIYPNPAINYLQVETSQAGNHTIIIRDIKGSICYTGNFNNQIQILVAPYAKGVYSITIINDETEVVWSDKFVKI